MIFVEINVFSPSIKTFDALKANWRTWSLSFINRHFGSKKSLLDQPDRSTQIVLSIGPICLALHFRPTSTPQDGKRHNMIPVFLRYDQSWKGLFKIQSKVIQGHKKYWLNTHWPLCAVYLFDNRFVNATRYITLDLSSNKLARITRKVAPSTNPSHQFTRGYGPSRESSSVQLNEQRSF